MAKEKANQSWFAGFSADTRKSNMQGPLTVNREIVKRLKALGFAFDRQAAGSHEIWYNQQADRYTTSPIILETCRKVHSGPFSSKRASRRTIS